MLVFRRLSFFLPPNLQGRLADHHQTLPRSTVTQIYKICSELWVAPSPWNMTGQKTSKFWRDFGQLRDLIANVSRMQQDIVSRKMALQTTDIPAQANLIWCILVHKRRKIGSDADPLWSQCWPTQRAAIRLGIAMHLVKSINFIFDFWSTALWPIKMKHNYLY